LREIASEHFAGTGCTYEFQCSLPQWRTEEILREHLESLGLKVEFGTEVTSVEDDPEGVRVTLDTGGRTETVTAAYVLGAGGGHSITRHSMHEHLTGETYDGRYFVADVKVRLPCPPECGRLVVGPAGFVLFSPLPDERWLIFVNCDEADTRRELPTGAELSALLNAKTGVEVGLNDLGWGGRYVCAFTNLTRLFVERGANIADARVEVGHTVSPCWFRCRGTSLGCCEHPRW
jgi:2-polyprenyl-6-methoxyphenol hydroxylase-like FAD-dependent oxidoreductase